MLTAQGGATRLRGKAGCVLTGGGALVLQEDVVDAGVVPRAGGPEAAMGDGQELSPVLLVRGLFVWGT